MAVQRLKEAAEKAKIELSSSLQVSVLPLSPTILIFLRLPGQFSPNLPYHINLFTFALSVFSHSTLPG